MAATSWRRSALNLATIKSGFTHVHERAGENANLGTRGGAGRLKGKTKKPHQMGPTKYLLLWVFCHCVVAQLNVLESTSTLQKYITASQTELVGLTVVTTFDQPLFVRSPTCGPARMHCLLSFSLILSSGVESTLCTTQAGCVSFRTLDTNSTATKVTIVSCEANLCARPFSMRKSKIISSVLASLLQR